MSNLKGKVALVTGGTGGIGAAICLKLAESGAKIATNYRNEEKAKAWQAEAKKAGHDIAVYQADVSDFDACQTLVDQVEKDLGPIDILVNNAGITKDGMFKKMSKDKWDAVMSINLDGLFNITKPLVEGMTDRGWGRIINISSINGQKGQLGQTNYAASKAGMHGFTMALAQEVARKGVTVNTVSPGYISTEMVMAVSEEIRNSIIANIPVNRLGTSEEIAALVDFLASEEAGFATGADFSMNGGQHMM
ncbi:MAG TPA: acetoacetyl-CoA reductase [Thiotrichaceae bacterium]|jgi:acetoacetyl-CoA reductase|nr:acetoacetyl-CoA reductase [Thiotrichaceae bacterium]HIM08883.1 acetoacetyl-CoA reductase [Gammaproteobacteria bacterium]